MNAKQTAIWNTKKELSVNYGQTGTYEVTFGNGKGTDFILFRPHGQKEKICCVRKELIISNH